MTEEQQDYYEKFLENLLRSSARIRSKSMEVQWYGNSRIWYLVNVGSKVKPPEPSSHSPHLYITPFRRKGGLTVEVALVEGKLRSDRTIGKKLLEGGSDLCAIKRIAETFYDNRWSSGILDEIRKILS